MNISGTNVSNLEKSIKTNPLFLFYSLGFYAKMISDALQKTISEGQVGKVNIKRV